MTSCLFTGFGVYVLLGMAYLVFVESTSHFSQTFLYPHLCKRCLNNKDNVLHAAKLIEANGSIELTSKSFRKGPPTPNVYIADS